MLWSLISSVYVIYLYRKLKAELEPAADEAVGAGGEGGIDAELEKLNAQIRALEARLTNSKGQETAP